MRTLLLALLFASTLCAKPTLWIIGDSTVRNGTKDQQGWGDPLKDEFDPAKIEVINRAIGGRSSRTFLTEGRWDAILANLKKGDYVLMQFGHNDGGDMFKGDRPRASIKGTGEESETGIVEATGKEETVHSYGWYMRKYCKDTIEKGATPIVCSLIPRNIRDKENVIRPDTTTYAKWAEEAAKATGAHFIPLNQLLCDKLNALEKEEVDAIFCGTDHTHTSPKGARFNAHVVAEALRQLPESDLGAHLQSAALWVPNLFNDHMVLQRDQPVPVWGRAIPGEDVVISLAGNQATAKADEEGNWKTTLPALPAGGPHKLEIAASESVAFEDVLVGEVWLCSGQSNMDFSLAPTEKRYFAGTTNWEEEVAAADQPQIRMFTAEWTMDEEPRRDVEGSWKVATPGNARDFSAVAWFFGRDLQKNLRVPVGLVTSAFGGSCAEAWVSPEKLRELPELERPLKEFFGKRLKYRDDVTSFHDYGKALARWESGGSKGRAPKHPDPVQDQHNPSVLYNGMIAPLIPYGIKGAIWYQGESNVATRQSYPAVQQALIEDWRTRWHQGDFPFYFVQLAAYGNPPTEPGDSGFALMREAQAKALSLPATGMAVTFDIGDEKDIHPRNKQDVGRRLALLALVRTYGLAATESGPTLKETNIEGDQIRIYFENLDGGLVAKDGPLEQFAIAGADGAFHWAHAEIEGDTVVVSHPDVMAPAFVRYAWADNPAGANLFNKSGLPAAPFRTDG